jgi:hypothetical protein
MCLLCGTCQIDTTAGRLSKEVIRKLYENRQLEGEVESRKENFLFFSKMPKTYLGESTIERSDTVICTDSTNCLAFKRDPKTGTFLLDMHITDNHGRTILKVVENTWQSNYSPWDVEVSGASVTFRSGPGEICFRAEFNSTENFVRVTHLNMTIGRSNVSLSENLVVITRWSRNGSRHLSVGYQFIILDSKAAIFLDDRKDLPQEVEDFHIVSRPSYGISIARRGSLYIQQVAVLSGSGFSCPRALVSSQEDAPKQAYVKGTMVIQTVHFPFWTEDEFYINGIKVENRPTSVYDVGNCPLGGMIEVFHIVGPDASFFSINTGLISTTLEDLPTKTS